MPYDLPLQPSLPFQSFDTTLAGDPFAFRIAWNAVDQAWYMDMATPNGTPIATAIKLVLGAIIGTRLAYRIDGAPTGLFYVIDTSGQMRDAGVDDLGTRVIVRYFDVQEIIARLLIGETVP